MNDYILPFSIIASVLSVSAHIVMARDKTMALNLLLIASLIFLIVCMQIEEMLFGIIGVLCFFASLLLVFENLSRKKHEITTYHHVIPPSTDAEDNVS